MKSFRTSLVLASATLALTWSVAASAEDNHGTKKDTKSTTTQSTTSQSGSSSTTSGDRPSDTSSSMDSSSGSTDTTTTMGTDTSSGDSTLGSGGATDGTGSTGSTIQPSTSTDPSATGTSGLDAQPYGTGAYDATGHSPTTSSTTTTTSTTYPASSTTTTAATYDPYASADKESSFRPNRPMLITGGAIFLGSYAASAIVAGTSNTQADNDYLAIPVAGPWINLAERPCGLGDCGSREDVNQALIIGSGVAQAAGIGLMVASLFVPENKERTVAKSAKVVAKPEVKVVPLQLRSGGGFGAIGTF